MKERQSGVLLHISSLPGKYGIGSLGQEAYDFVDFLVRTKQRYWQILPLGPTSYGDSPYQSFSAFAGNTHLIDFDTLVAEGWLSPEDLEGIDFGHNPYAGGGDALGVAWGIRVVVRLRADHER